MKTIHLNKLTAIMGVKARDLLSKNFIIMPIFALGFTVGLKLLYQSISGEGLTDSMLAGVAGFGALMNISMGGLSCVAAGLAEEKEKHTLRTLMTSSINGLEFFFGSTIPVILMMLTVNIFVVPLGGLSMTASQWAVYLGVSLLASVASAVLGMIFGIYCKNQVTVGTVTGPAIFILMLIPCFADFHEILEKLSGFLFTGIMMKVIGNIAMGEKQLINPIGVGVMAAEIILAVMIFLVIYKKNGYDPE